MGGGGPPSPGAGLGALQRLHLSRQLKQLLPQPPQTQSPSRAPPRPPGGPPSAVGRKERNIGV